MGFHAMAVDERIRCGVAFAPLVELPVLEELHGLENHDLTNRLALTGMPEKFSGRPIWICIGNNDERVGVDRVIAFTRGIVAASLARSQPAAVEIHIMHTEGHYTHDTAHEEAALLVGREIRGVTTILGEGLDSFPGLSPPPSHWDDRLRDQKLPS